MMTMLQRNSFATLSSLWCFLFVCLILVARHCQSFLLQPHQPIATRQLSTSLQAEKRPVVAIVGGHLAGVVAACTIAQQQHKPSPEVWLLTGQSQILQGFSTSGSILPDVTLDNRQLIERYASGGRELAGIFAKQFTPLRAKEWLEEQGILLQEGGDITSNTPAMVILVGEKPLAVHPKCNLQQILEDTLETSQVKIETNVKIESIDYKKKTGFTITQSGKILNVDVLILAGEHAEIPTTPIFAPKDDSHNNDASSKKKKKVDPAILLNNLLDEVDLDEPLSLKDEMKLEKKQQADAKRKNMDFMAANANVNGGNVDSELFKELSKQEQRTLAKKRKKEAKKQKEQVKQTKKGPSAADAVDIDSKNVDTKTIPSSPVIDGDDKEIDSKAEEPTTSTFSFSTKTATDTLALATKLGHAITKEAIGMFSFMVPTRGILEGCATSIVPKARLRCRVNDASSGRSRLPKWEGPLLVSQGELSGPAALRLSTLIAHEIAAAGNKGTLQIHFAPDIGGVEEVEAALLETANPVSSVLKSPCPLLHREIDYDDYDMETGDFKSVEYPLVPKRLWGNLCREAGISASKMKWKDLPPASVQALARLLVDSPLAITGIRPNDNVMAGGVNLKEVNMAGCQSQKVEGLFLCGSVIDVHGFDGGFNSLSALATGYVVGSHAMVNSVDVNERHAET